MKRCKCCGVMKPLDEFYANRACKDGHEGTCKACRIERDARTYHERMEDPEARNSRREQQRKRLRAAKQRERGGVRVRVVPPSTKRERANAHLAVVYALKTGRLVKPEACQRCGAVGELEGHHHDYTKKLEVEWLCVSCHKRAHYVTVPVAAESAAGAA